MLNSKTFNQKGGKPMGMGEVKHQQLKPLTQVGINGLIGLFL